MDQDVSQHPGLLAELTRNYDNTIMLLDSKHPIDRYTCLMYVLDFTEKEEYVDIAVLDMPNVYAGEKFAQWLLDNSKLKEIQKSDAKKGDIIFYFVANKFKHTGILCEKNRVISKWGTGHLYEHGIFEAPSSYGMAVRFFEPLDYDDAYYYFTEYAEENGIVFEKQNPNN